MICPRCNREIPDDAALCCYCGRVFVKKKPSGRKPNGSGTAFKRGNTWSVKVTVALDVTPEGKLRQIRKEKGGFATKAEALAYAPTLLAESTRKKDRAPTLQHYWDLYSTAE